MYLAKIACYISKRICNPFKFPLLKTFSGWLSFKFWITNIQFAYVNCGMLPLIHNTNFPKCIHKLYIDYNAKKSHFAFCQIIGFGTIYDFA